MDGGQLPFGLDHNTIKPGAVRSMTSDKLASFSLGTTKKTPYQKHKEAKEAKRKNEEEAAAKEYAQWVDSFESGDGAKKFVRGETQGGTAMPDRDGGGRPDRGGGSRGFSGVPPQAMFGGQEEDIDGEDIDGEPLPGQKAALQPKTGPARISAPVLRKKEAVPVCLSPAPYQPLIIRRSPLTDPQSPIDTCCLFNTVASTHLGCHVGWQEEGDKAFTDGHVYGGAPGGAGG